MKTIISALVATTLLGSIALADEIDDQIQKLEKENKLLELQKKKKELEMQNQISSKDDSLPSDKKPKKTKNPNSKNGGFIGVEGVLGGGDLNFSVSEVDTYSDPSPADIFYPIATSSSNTTFDLGLVGGYQHYFGDSQRHGIKVSAHLYSGFGNNYKMNYDEIPSVYTDTNVIEKNFSNDKVSINYIPIKFGFDVKYLYDFLQRGKHTLGLNVGLGYEFDAYINGKENVTSTTDSSYSNTTNSTTITHHSENHYSYNLDNIYSNGIYPVIGLHYYYGHHQFELMYRFGGIFNQIASKNVAHNHFEDKASSKIDKKPVDVSVDITHKIVLNTKSYLTINYAYRF